MRLIEFRGVSRSLADWARLSGMRSETLAKRLNAGWSVEEALATPVGKQGRKPKPLAARSVVQSLPALRDWQRDMHAAHREMTRSVRSFVRQMEEQMAELRHGLDQHLAAQLAEADRNMIASHTRGVGQSISKNANDRCPRVTQESV
ncbi:hypothetical protein GGD63_006133 [Bradyrhizobium sp. cir1]|uniref:hypothetical protein n=1 Tax=Bradyrhizobium sp. cir1 TaxID=1445730 RepID=UPI001606818E|nr:hypothetical protein [Bradyrhizobium sp. cir1]MBB4373311.1 hypothetical protein [Bradyrhizobium sp. cir1]